MRLASTIELYAYGKERKFHSVQFNLEPSDASRVLSIPIRPNDFSSKGRETSPHLTVLFGIHKDVADQDIAKMVSGYNDISVKLGDYEVFPDSGDGEPLVIRVNSGNLNTLHSALRMLPHTDTYPEYKAHISVGYLKPGVAEKYLAVGNPMSGDTITLRNLVLSKADYTEVSLSKDFGPRRF